MRLITVITGDYQTNTYIIVEGENAVIIDPGAQPEKIIKAMTAVGAKPKAVLLTHSHFDHTGAVSALASPGVAVYMSQADHDFHKNNSGEYVFSTEPFKVDHFVSDGEKLELFGNSYTVIFTPGHTPGGVCYLCGNILFSGDTLFKAGVGRTDFPGGDSDALITSLSKLIKLDPATIVYPGHGPSTTIAFEIMHNPYVD